MSAEFIGRKEELQQLNRLLQQKGPRLVVVKGRRRIGKSRLIKEFAKDYLFYEFAGLPPTSITTAQSQREEFTRQLEEKLDLKGIKSDDWGDLFTVLARHTRKGKIVILLNEISWMGSKDPDFLGKLKNAWDMQFNNNLKLILVLCGSVSTWIEKNIINSTGFVGRLTLTLTLDELPLFECNHFWDKYGEGVSAYEKFKILSVTGGIPRYLELINPKHSTEENIKQLCFVSSGTLVNEFEHIFTDIFSKRSKLYKNILEQLTNGSLTQEILSKKINLPRTGELSEYLDDLVLSGFITRDFTWHLKTGKISKLSRYRLRDNYVRFYLKYILPNKAKIEKKNFHLKTLTALPGWDSMMGFQFENLVLNNHPSIISLLRIHPEDLVFDNPFFQRKTSRTPGCQIDYLVQTRFNSVYVCEIKFSRFEITADIIPEMREKLKRLKLPRHFSYRPVLIHVNGVREDVADSGFFSEIIDFSQLLDNGSPG
jgi:uncharacterized protein